MKQNNKEIELSILSQTHQLRKSQERILELNNVVNDIYIKNNNHKNKLEELDEMIEKLFEGIGIDRDNLDLDNVKPLIEISKEEKECIKNSLPTFKTLDFITFQNYDDYVKSVDKYLKDNEIDTTKDPIMQMLSTDEIKGVLKEYNEKYGNIPWDKYDYSVIGLAVFVAFLVDLFIVSIPKDMKWHNEPNSIAQKLGIGSKNENGNFKYNGSPVTKFLREESNKITNAGKDDGIYRFLKDAQKKLEVFASVPYDKSRNGENLKIDGLRPSMHRLMSLGHDPVLCLVFGVMDFMRGSMTMVDKNGIVNVVQTGEKNFNVFEAFIKTVAHILSDVTTPAGIQPPFFSLLQTIKLDTNLTLGKNGQTVNVNDIVRFMYSNGYDLRHFATMSIVPFVIEFIIRNYYNLNNFQSLYVKEKDVFHKYKLNSMITLAHTMSASTNFIKFWLQGINPLALNYSEFLTVIKSFICMYKSRDKKYDYIDAEILKNWENLIRY